MQRSHANFQSIRINQNAVLIVQQHFHRVEIAGLWMHQKRPPRLHIVDFNVSLHIVRRCLGNDVAFSVQHIDRHGHLRIRCVANDLIEYATARIDDVRCCYHIGNELNGRCVQHNGAMNSGIVEEVE